MTTTSQILSTIDAAVAEAKATNRNYEIPQACIFLSRAIETDNPIGKKQAGQEGIESTAEAIMRRLEVSGNCITEEKMMKVRSLVSYFESMVPRNEFEEGVVRHTLESLRLGRVEPRSAAFVAWAGKIYKDRVAAEAASIEAQSTPTGKAAFTAFYEGVREAYTSFGLKAVHAFKTSCGKNLEWWTDIKMTDVDAQGKLLPVALGEVHLNCRIKGSSFWKGKLIYKITHAKWVAT